MRALGLFVRSITIKQAAEIENKEQGSNKI